MSPLAAPPLPAPGRLERMTTPLVTGALLATAVLALHLRDPHQQGSWGICPSAVLGFWCPGCGALRAVNDLTRGDAVAAGSSNLLFLASVPLIVAILARWTWGRWTGRAWSPDSRSVRRLTYAYGAVAVVFAVARNLPGSWLAP